MYNYTYDNSRIEQAVESEVTFNEHGFVNSKTVVSSIRYYYDNEGKLTKKRIIHADGEQVVTRGDKRTVPLSPIIILFTSLF